MDMFKFQDKYGKDLSCPIFRVNRIVLGEMLFLTLQC